MQIPYIPHATKLAFLSALIVGLTSTYVRSQDSAKVRIRTETISTEAGSSFVVEHTEGIDSRYEPIIQRLVKDGWSEDTVRARFANPLTVYIPKLTVISPKKPGSSKNWYTWVNTAESAESCKSFTSLYRSILEQAETRFGVDKETIVALLLCETRHGTVTGSYHIFSVFASTALANNGEVIQRNINKARNDLEARGASKKAIASSLEYIRARSEKKGEWAYKELTNLLKMDRSGHVDVLSIYGSWAGAFGWSQFLPSSFVRSAVDGNGDTRIDLFNPADAIFSVANYLDKAGFKSGNTASIRSALRNYNNSTDYVNSIMALAARIKTDS